jgi:hypothetical protein
MPKETKPRASKADKGEKPTKAKKDPNAPKRPLSAYMFFSQDQRATVKEENPEASFGESFAPFRRVNEAREVR